MTTPSKISTIIEIKLWTMDKFLEMEIIDIEPVSTVLLTTTGGCSWWE